MRNIWFYIFLMSALISCDDGDIITVELEFNGELDRCDNNTDDWLLYDELDDPIEALILTFQRSTENDALFTTEIPADNPTILTIDNNTVRFVYRTYNAEPAFCEVLDENFGIVTSSSSAPSGTVEISTTVEDSDNDGISSDQEDLNSNGDLTDDDSDGDGIPNYLDEDDDNDNVLTIDENPDPDGDGDISDAQNTNADEDDIPDYLDNDDDGDGILTRLEDEDGNQDPTLDFDEESETPNIARYLNAQSNEIYDDPGLISTSFIRQYRTTFIVNEVDLGVIRYDRRTFGTYDSEPITISND